jgi:hypothetical protein
MWLKQSTACTITLGPFVDDTDGKTAETGLTISQADVRLRKNGGAAAQANEATSATHDENGYYSKPLSTTDTNTAGRLLVSVSESGALPVWHEFTVLPAAVYDGLITGTLFDDIADAMLDRDMGEGTDSSSNTFRTPRSALRQIRNKWSISGSTITYTKENDSTTSHTAALTGTTGADPITACDPG